MTEAAVFLCLHTVGMSLFILCRIVITLFAFCAFQCDSGTHGFHLTLLIDHDFIAVEKNALRKPFLRAKKMAVSLAILFAIFYTGMSNIQFSDETIIGSMINISKLQAEGQLYDGEDPRVTEYKYFFSDYSKNIITDVFGNGVPNINTSYGKYKAQQEMKGIYLSDVGYPSIYVFLGLIGLFVYVFLFIRGTFQKLPEELGYINMFMAFMIPANVAASWYMGADTQLALAICVYLIYIYRNNPKLIER